MANSTDSLQRGLNTDSNSRYSVHFDITVNIFELDNMVVNPPNRCSKCSRCHCVSEEGVNLSCKELEEKLLLEKSVTVENGKTSVVLPFIRSPDILQDNRSDMIRRAEGQWKSLKKKGFLDHYNSEFRKYLNPTAISHPPVVEVSIGELDNYCGPKNYISHHHVLQPEKPSTPVRIVSNSSQDNHGISLNQLVAKGPNLLSNLYKLLIRFRFFEVGVGLDIAKAYHTLHFDEVAKFLHLMIWKFEEDEPWRTFAYVVVPFGGVSAAGQSECAKKRATIAREILDDPRACEIIENELYVDDGATGGTIEEVDRLVGVKDPITGLYTGTLQQILSIGGFKIKEFMISGRRSDESKKLLGDGILGYQWESSVDIMAVRLKANLSKSNKKVHRYPDFTLDDLPRLRNVKLTKRKLLMLIGSIYDPFSILSPFTVKLKISMGELTAVCPNQTWDTTIPDNFNQE